MSEKQEKRKRLNQKLQYIFAFERWLAFEPPIILFWKWRKWKAARPAIPWNTEQPESEESTDEGYEN